MIHIMHRHILQGEKWNWYIDDVTKPLLAALIIIGVGRLVIDIKLPNLILILNLGSLLFIAIFASAMSIKFTRNMLYKKIKSMKDIVFK